jgi:hypothetical protein
MSTAQDEEERGFRMGRTSTAGASPGEAVGRVAVRGDTRVAVNPESETNSISEVGTRRAAWSWATLQGQSAGTGASGRRGSLSVGAGRSSWQQRHSPPLTGAVAGAFGRATRAATSEQQHAFGPRRVASRNQTVTVRRTCQLHCNRPAADGEDQHGEQPGAAKGCHHKPEARRGTRTQDPRSRFGLVVKPRDGHQLTSFPFRSYR